MQKMRRSRSSNAKERGKDARKHDRARHSNSPATRRRPHKYPVLLDIETMHEMYDDYIDLHGIPVLVYSAKFQAVRNTWFWESAYKRGYFVDLTKTRAAVLRPVLRLYNSVTDITSDPLSWCYELKQPVLGVRSRRPTEPYCRFARQLWLQNKMPPRPAAHYRLLGIDAVSYPPPTARNHQVEGLLSRALSEFQEFKDVASFPVFSGLRKHFREVTDFLAKMTALKDSRLAVPEQAVRDRVVIVEDWPWRADRLSALMEQQYEVSESEDDANADSGALAPERSELHASRDISVCLLYRLSLVTHSILQYLIFINVGVRGIQEQADEVLITAVRQQTTESVLEMHLEPSTHIVDAIFDAVMKRAAALVHRSGTSKHLRVRTLHQCRLGSAVASWQMATHLLAGIVEAFSGAVVAELGREDKRHKYCIDCLALIPRLKDDCLYQIFSSLRLRHRTLGLLKAQHTDPLDPVVAKAVVLLSKIAVTYALHLFRTQKVQPRHVYLRRRELQEDFGRFLAIVSGKFSVMAPQSPTTVNVISGGRLRLFMVDMLVHYYTEVVEASDDDQQAVLE